VAFVEVDESNVGASGKDDYKKLKLSADENSKYQEIIDKNLKIGREIGVNGTPAVYDSTGKPMQWPELLKK
jgi:protein-disulfide isomerase